MRIFLFFIFIFFFPQTVFPFYTPTKYRATYIVGGVGELEHPTDISIDKFGAIYITDTGNGRVKKFDKRGKHLKTFGALLFPTGIACFDDWVYVVDKGRNVVRKFTLLGEPLPLELPSKGSSERLNDLCISPDGDLYVVGGDRSCTADEEYLYVAGLDRIQKFKIPEMRLVLEFGEWGEELGQVRAPQGIAVDKCGAIYVSDTLNNRIQKFSQDGKFLTSFGRFGHSIGELFHPMGIAVSENGDVWVVEEGNHRIQKFSPVFEVSGKPPSRDYAWLYTHARRLQTLGKHHEAIAYYTKCIDLAPKHDPLVSRCEFYRGKCWAALKNFEFALLAYERVIKEYPHSREAPRALLLKGDISYQVGLIDEAIRSYKLLVDHYPETIYAKRAKLRLLGLR